MIRYVLLMVLLAFPSMLYSEEPVDNSDEQKIRALIQAFYSGSGDKELDHRWALLSNWDKKMLVKDQVVNIWAHQLHVITLKQIKHIVIIDREAKVLVEIDFKPYFKEKEIIKIVPVYAIKENDQWKIAYLYFQPPLFTTYP